MEMKQGYPPPSARESHSIIISPHPDVISVRKYLVYTSYFFNITIAVFTVAIVFMNPGPENESGELRYISEGMERHCGWSIVVLGTSSTFTCVTHFIAAIHIENKSVFAFIILECIGWNVVLGVIDTGWTLHYVGLMSFLIGILGFNWICSRDINYGTLTYKTLNMISVIFAIIFMGMAVISSFNPNVRELRGCAVSLEFVVMGSFTVQSFIFASRLNQYKEIYIMFHHR